MARRRKQAGLPDKPTGEVANDQKGRVKPREAGNTHQVQDQALIPTRTKEAQMAGIDETKGRAKRAVGELTGDDELKREGTIDKTTGKAKDVVDKVADKTKDTLRKNK
jgi:uncharacterized protein YjbJ (UPF0337 family)